MSRYSWYRYSFTLYYNIKHYHFAIDSEGFALGKRKFRARTIICVTARLCIFVVHFIFNIKLYTESTTYEYHMNASKQK